MINNKFLSNFLTKFVFLWAVCRLVTPASRHDPGWASRAIWPPDEAESSPTRTGRAGVLVHETRADRDVLSYKYHVYRAERMCMNESETPGGPTYMYTIRVCVSLKIFVLGHVLRVNEYFPYITSTWDPLRLQPQWTKGKRGPRRKKGATSARPPRHPAARRAGQCAL